MTPAPAGGIRPATGDALSRAFGEPGAKGVIRRAPEDFRVDEIPLVAPDGDGEHLLIRLLKRGHDTEAAALALAAALGTPRRDISYAGRKDRHALTTQWFSARLPGIAPSGWETTLPVGMDVLASQRHRRKLKRGALRGNQFRIVVRDLEGDIATLASRVEHLKAEGVPNYFGPQRFGREGRNVMGALKLFQGERARLSRNRRSLFLSAARAQIFNTVLARRVAQASWNALTVGDVANLSGSRSVFSVDEIDDDLRDRVARHDVHPTGPLWGSGTLASCGGVRELELAVAHSLAPLSTGLAKAGVRHARRSLRASVADLALDLDGATATFSFTLATGEFATAVLAELLHYHDAEGHAQG